MREGNDYQILTDALERMGIGYKEEGPEKWDVHDDVAREPRFPQGERVDRIVELIGSEPSLLFNKEGDYLGALYYGDYGEGPIFYARAEQWGSDSPILSTEYPTSFAERVMAVKRGPAAPTAEDVERLAEALSPKASHGEEGG